MNKIISRRSLLNESAAMATGALLLKATGALATEPHDAHDHTAGPPATSATPEPSQAPVDSNLPYTPVITPNGVTAPFKIVAGVKVFHLVASEFDHEFAPGLVAKCWGYNGRTPGPTIEVVEGDRVRIYVTNKLPEPTAVHWHGLRIPCGMDGVAGVTQEPIQPGQTFKYEFEIRQNGTYMYHSHYDEMTQMALGMMGMFVIHPKNPVGPKVDRDFVLMLSEWRIDPGTRRPNPNEMTEFNVLTFNSKAFPATAPLVCKKGDRVRIRMGNLSAMDHHPIHIHGHNWVITGTDGGPIPPSAQWPETTILVPVGSTRDGEFIADNPGDWALHCHMSHHTMNQMGHKTPNLVGVSGGGLRDQFKPLLPGYMTMGQSGMGEMGKHTQHMPQPDNTIAMRGADGPFGYIDMGGMFTTIKIREHYEGQKDPGWYSHPQGTVAAQAEQADMARDGIEPG